MLPFAAHSKAVKSLRWDPKGTKFCSVSRDLCLNVFSPMTGSHTRFESAHKRIPTALAWHPNSKIIATASGDHSVALYDTEKSSKDKIIAILSFSASVLSIAFAHNGNKIACGAAGLNIYELNQRHRPATREPEIFGDPLDKVSAVCWSVDDVQL